MTENAGAPSPEAEEDAAFAEAFEPEKEEVEGEGEGVEEPAEVTPKEEEPEEAPAAEATPESVQPAVQRVAHEANRSSLLGRIQGAEKGLPKMQKSYRELYGPLPGDKTQEEVEAEAKVAATVEEVSAEIPEIATVIDHKVGERVAQAVEGIEERLAETRLDDAKATHEATIFAEHPEAAAYQADTPERELLQSWVGSLSHADGTQVTEVISRGNAVDINKVLSRFKEAVKGELANLEAEGAVTSTATQKAALDAEAVPGGQGGLLTIKPQAADDDFSASFAEAPD